MTARKAISKPKQSLSWPGKARDSCRLSRGKFWEDPAGRHLVGCVDAASASLPAPLRDYAGQVTLALHDPPYNIGVLSKLPVDEYIEFCRRWIENSRALQAPDSSLYVWLGADQRNHFQPLPQFMSMMTVTDFTSRSFLTLRNQRGYGTGRNWMAVRQELLCYTLGRPEFVVQYTDIPKILRGYYKNVSGRRTENIERSKSDCIRPGNVWVDIQQVFYRMEENVPGCYAQKPLKAVERIILASSRPDDLVVDFFSHSGTTLLACERTGRRCLTLDIDPIFAELTIRRLERYRETGKTGWQRDDPFAGSNTEYKSKTMRGTGKSRGTRPTRSTRPARGTGHLTNKRRVPSESTRT